MLPNKRKWEKLIIAEFILFKKWAYSNLYKLISSRKYKVTINSKLHFPQVNYTPNNIQQPTWLIEVLMIFLI